MSASSIVQMLVDGVALGSLYALIALGIALTFGVMGLVNFAQAEFITLAAYVLLRPTRGDNAELLLAAMPLPAMILLDVTFVVVVSLVVERLVFRPLRNRDPSTLFIASFALGFVLQKLIELLYTTKPKTVDLGFQLTSSIHVGSIRVSGAQIIVAILSVSFMIGLAAFLRFSLSGLRMRAAAENFALAQLRGVRANAVIAASFGISGALAAVAALLILVQGGIFDNTFGVLPVIYAFFGTVLGGMGTLVGAAAGAFLLGFASQMLQALLPDAASPYRDAFIFGAVIFLLLIRPQGLFVSASRRRLI